MGQKLSSFSIVIVETRSTAPTIPLIKNSLDVCGEETPVILFVGRDFPREKLRVISANFPTVKVFRTNVEELKAPAYNDLLRSLALWDLVLTDFALVVQTDGCLCRNSAFRLSDFFRYDYVGGYAPEGWWRKELPELAPGVYQSFNGGFSLRRVSSMRRVIREFPPVPNKTYYPGQPMEEYAEDIYFVAGFMKLGFTVALDEFGTNFCSHTRYKIGTFAVHRTARYPTQKFGEEGEFLKYCPEYLTFI